MFHYARILSLSRCYGSWKEGKRQQIFVIWLLHISDSIHGVGKGMKGHEHSLTAPKSRLFCEMSITVSSAWKKYGKMTSALP